ncbi:hypothetical protein EDB81DRAFT_517467 [Dactylonectria macrodidyma]|uniref:Uncharacterized protein n=1 Tax=Dactylonectria macrodidyma TaxID=307937 RepID=A0A9P9J641_9HYPO|nr:hypothetical protein EDB81DRAFT_517467 [Dactylonectria macrodidyma]
MKPPQEQKCNKTKNPTKKEIDPGSSEIPSMLWKRWRRHINRKSQGWQPLAAIPTKAFISTTLFAWIYGVKMGDTSSQNTLSYPDEPTRGALVNQLFLHSFSPCRPPLMSVSLFIRPYLTRRLMPSGFPSCSVLLRQTSWRRPRSLPHQSACSPSRHHGDPHRYSIAGARPEDPWYLRAPRDALTVIEIPGRNPCSVALEGVPRLGAVLLRVTGWKSWRALSTVQLIKMKIMNFGPSRIRKGC